MSQEDIKSVYEPAMNELQNFVGQEIIVIYWEDGKLNGLKGILENMIPFDFVNLEGKIINFVGNTAAIQAISADDKMVYYNQNTENYQGFSFKDILGLILAQEEILGYSVRRQEVMGNEPQSGGRK